MTKGRERFNDTGNYNGSSAELFSWPMLLWQISCKGCDGELVVSKELTFCPVCGRIDRMDDPNPVTPPYATVPDVEYLGRNKDDIPRFHIGPKEE